MLGSAAMSRVAILLAAAAVLVAGCDRRKGPAAEMKPADDWGDPSNPHAEVAPTDDPHAGLDMNGGDDDEPANPHAGVDMSGGGGDLAPAEDREIDPNKYLRGTIVLTDATKGKVPAGAVLFLAAKAADAAGNPSGPPLAVQKLDVGTFPMDFSLDERDEMMAGTNFSGAVVITARIDQDSDVGSRQPGDLSGKVAANVPAKDLQLQLDTIEP
jgi:hypothetical protein